MLNSKQIVLKLLSNRVLLKKEVEELFSDEAIRSEVENSLSTIGLELATHIYTQYVSIRVKKEYEAIAFDNLDTSLPTNIPLSRGSIALLTIFWAKLILPKRKMQIERLEKNDLSQSSFFNEKKSIPQDIGIELDEKSIRTDFEEKLGGKGMFSQYLNQLKNVGFIISRSEKIIEGPLLDTLIDYDIMAQRIISGCLNFIIKKSEGD